MARANPLRFSTQYADDAVRGVKYLFRDYDAHTGRWPNRDPIGERGGANLYGFIYNDGVNNVDGLGLAGQPANPYDGYDKDKDVTKYNCAGIAFRSFNYTGLEDAKKELAKGKSIDCSKDCAPCEIKFWLWEYKLRLESSTGTGLTQWGDDFHMVGAPVSCENGKELKNCYCKNGARPVTGPVLPSEQRPAEKEVATSNDANAQPITGPDRNPINKVRKDFKQSCYCAPPPSTTSPPTKK